MKLYTNDGSQPRYTTYESTVASQQTQPIQYSRVTIVTIGDEHFVEFGANPSATTTSFPIPSDSVMTFDIAKGSRIAFRAHNTGGHISILGEDLVL